MSAFWDREDELPQFETGWPELETGWPARVVIDGVEIVKGSRVRLRPRPGGDIMDLVLDGKVAVVEGFERDYEDNLQIAVTVEDDPGQDLGELRQPGHRFFFSVLEVEPV